MVLVSTEDRASLWHKAQNGRSPRSALREDRIQDGAADVAETGSDLRMMPNSLMDGDTTARSGGGQCGKCWVLVHIQGFGAQMLLSDVFFLGNDHLYAGMCPAGLSVSLENGHHDRKRVCVWL